MKINSRAFLPWKWVFFANGSCNRIGIGSVVELLFFLPPVLIYNRYFHYAVQFEFFFVILINRISSRAVIVVDFHSDIYPLWTIFLSYFFWSHKKQFLHFGHHKFLILFKQHVIISQVQKTLWNLSNLLRESNLKLPIHTLYILWCPFLITFPLTKIASTIQQNIRARSSHSRFRLCFHYKLKKIIIFNLKLTQN